MVQQSIAITTKLSCQAQLERWKTKFLAEEISAVRLQQKEILDLLEEVKSLRLQNEEINRGLAYLESRVDDLLSTGGGLRNGC